MAQKDHITGAETLMDRGRALKTVPTQSYEPPPNPWDLSFEDDEFNDDAVDSIERLERETHKARLNAVEGRDPEMG